MREARWCGGRPWTLLLVAIVGVFGCGDEAQVIGPPSTAGEAPAEPGEGEPAEGVESSSSLEVDAPAAGGRPVGNSGGAGAQASTEQPPASPAAQSGASEGASLQPTPARALRGGCDLGQRIGGFSVEAQVDFGVIQGVVADAVLPTEVPRLAGEVGPCRLQERRILVCLPACGGSEACGESGSCIPYPRQLDIGVVDIAGLTRATSMTPLQPGNTYFSPGADNPPYASDAQIVLTAQGGSGVAAFELLGHGSAPLVDAPSWQLARGQALSLSWPVPSTPAPTHVLVELTIDQHGASPFTLSCELEDTGSASVPAAIIEQLIDAGVSGFPNGRIMRRTADHVQLEQGCVELVVGSPRSANVTLAGYTPCINSAACPSGQSCNTTLQRCE